MRELPPPASTVTINCIHHPGQLIPLVVTMARAAAPQAGSKQWPAASRRPAPRIGGRSTRSASAAKWVPHGTAGAAAAAEQPRAPVLLLLVSRAFSNQLRRAFAPHSRAPRVLHLTRATASCSSLRESSSHCRSSMAARALCALLLIAAAAAALAQACVSDPTAPACAGFRLPVSGLA